MRSVKSVVVLAYELNCTTNIKYMYEEILSLKLIQKKTENK